MVRNEPKWKTGETWLLSYSQPIEEDGGASNTNGSLYMRYSKPFWKMLNSFIKKGINGKPKRSTYMQNIAFTIWIEMYVTRFVRLFMSTWQTKMKRALRYWGNWYGEPVWLKWGLALGIPAIVIAVTGLFSTQRGGAVLH